MDNKGMNAILIAVLLVLMFGCGFVAGIKYEQSKVQVQPKNNFNLQYRDGEVKWDGYKDSGSVKINR